MRPDDLDVLKQLQAVSNTGMAHTIWHYLYFPHEHIAKEVAATLRKQGFLVEDRLGADNVNWLLLIKMQVVPTESAVAEMCAFFERIAAENGGEHDGWEADVLSNCRS